MERGKGNTSHYSDSEEAPWPAGSIPDEIPFNPEPCRNKENKDELAPYETVRG